MNSVTTRYSNRRIAQNLTAGVNARGCNGAFALRSETRAGFAAIRGEGLGRA